MQDTEATTTTSRRDSRFMRGRVAQPLDVLVDRGVLLDVGVGLRDVRLGLVVVVVARRSTRPRCSGSISRSSLASCAASVLFGAITSVGRCSRSISQAVVADLPVPVAPSSTTSCSPARSRRSSSSMAAGWSPAGWYSLTTSNRPPLRGISPTGRNSECATGTSALGGAAGDLCRECHEIQGTSTPRQFPAAPGPAWEHRAGAPAEDRDLRRRRRHQHRHQGLSPARSTSTG